jgi:hypothetical protein
MPGYHDDFIFITSTADPPTFPAIFAVRRIV